MIFDELGVEAEDGAECAFDLRGSVVARLEDADGGFDEGVEDGDVGVGGEADVERRGHGLDDTTEEGMATESQRAPESRREERTEQE